jgi:hypothetical protein
MAYVEQLIAEAVVSVPEEGGDTIKKLAQLGASGRIDDKTNVSDKLLGRATR